MDVHELHQSLLLVANFMASIEPQYDKRSKRCSDVPDNDENFHSLTRSLLQYSFFLPLPISSLKSLRPLPKDGGRHQRCLLPSFGNPSIDFGIVSLCQWFQAEAMGAASSDFVDPETLPLKILLEKGKEQSGVDEKKVQDDKSEDTEKLLRDRCWELQREKTFWRDYAWQMEKELDNAKWAPLSLTSPLTRWSEKMQRPDRVGTDWQWYKTNCPCCRRPLEITVSPKEEEPLTPHPRGSGYAFVVAFWGANAGYALGALVLGFRLKEVSPQIKRVMVHTDDVPSNYLEAFQKDGLWQLRKVDYIDGVPDLYVTKGNIFDGVFTKLAVWTLEEYDKVLLLDIDIIPLKPLDELFDLPCPAAMVRGQGSDIHGDEVDGSRFFGTEDYQDYPWGQSGGINAGLILLQPDSDVFQQMLSEVTCKNHPCHVAGSGPEQDYLSRFFAARKDYPWHHISVAWNYQLHQSLFAIERVLQWRGNMEKNPYGRDFSNADKEWLPQRLRMKIEEIGVVHFSGEVKMWHRVLEATSSQSADRRREVRHALALAPRDSDGDGGNGDVVFAEKLMSYQQGHALWISKTAPLQDYDFYGCRREGCKIFVGEKDITDALDQMVHTVLAVAAKASKVWHECYEKLAWPGLLEGLQNPKVPEGCFDLGTRVEVSWTMGQGSRANVQWLPAQVLGVHENKDYVVRFERWADWGDTERHVHPDRVRLPAA